MSLLERLRAQAGDRCGYCRSSSRIMGQPLSIEHIIPLSRGGSSDEHNLWLSCRRCNEFKGAQIEAVDPQTGLLSPLYHPRQQHWRDHFAWSGDGLRIVGLTPAARDGDRAPAQQPDHRCRAGVVGQRRLASARRGVARGARAGG